MKYAEILFFKVLIYKWQKYKSLLLFCITITSNALRKLIIQGFFDFDKISVREISGLSPSSHTKFYIKSRGFLKVGKIVDYHSSELSKQEFNEGKIITPLETPFFHPGYPHREFWRWMKYFFISIIECDDRKFAMP